METQIGTCRVTGSATGADPLDVAAEHLVAVAPHAELDGCVHAQDSSAAEGTDAWSCMLDGSMMVTMAAPGATTSPRFTGRWLTIPEIGARMTVLPS